MKTKPRTVDDGTEIDTTATVEAIHYIPAKDVGRMHMTMHSSDWSDKASGLRGSVYMVGNEVVVTVDRRGSDGMPHHVIFPAKNLIMEAMAIYMGGKCPRCSGPAALVDAAPAGESGDVVRCPTCDH